jgi:hypothetical protein
MNKPQPYKNLIPVRDYNYITRRGFKASVQYIYKLIKLNKETGRKLPFRYREIGKGIWIEIPKN